MVIGSVILFAVAALLLGIGAAIRFGHAYFLIAGYNTATPEQRAHVNTRGLGLLLARMCLLLAVLLAVAGGLALAGFEAALLSLLLILPITFVTIWQAQKYDGNACDEEGHVKKGRRVTLTAVMVFPTLLTIGVLALVFYSAKPPAITVSDGELTISGLYHESIALSDIRSAELLDSMPAVGEKVSGTGLGSRMYGSFDLKNGDRVRLYVDASKPPFIRLTEKDGHVTILNAGSGEKTRELYGELPGASG